MKQLLAISTVCFALAALVGGCGGGTVMVKSARLAWSSDGNTGVPVCPAPGRVCKAKIEIRDLTTGATSYIDLAQTSFVAPSALHVYAARVDGEDASGAPLYSDFTYAEVSR